MTELVVRLVFSLAVVLGLLLLTARLGARRFKGRSGSPVRVLHRQALSRTSSVTVVTVGSRVLVLGTTEQQVRVLAELDPDELEGLGDTSGDGSGEPELELAPVAHLVSAPTASSPGFAALLHDQLETPAPPAPTSAGRHAAPRSHAAPRRTVSRRGAPPTTTAPAGGALAGSVLSPQTWRQALQALSGRAS
ncbi:flagellar biosynthetic protein FliO [Nocardioides psychrotolerans]|uniref:flagellar biosynthetic protein FliO n=1 Tax=Nocardioides psychrotolerans TaxID=1005945 RepID=UPI0031381D85